MMQMPIRLHILSQIVATPERSPTVDDHKSSADERQEEADRNSAGHANPGSNAGTEELSGYAG